jgi:hypothetical protein
VTAGAVLAVLLVAALLLAAVFVWWLRSDTRAARRMVRELRATSPHPAYPIPGDAAVCAANRLDLTPTLRRTEEQALERLFALPAKEIR